MDIYCWDFCLHFSFYFINVAVLYNSWMFIGKISVFCSCCIKFLFSDCITLFFSDFEWKTPKVQLSVIVRFIWKSKFVLKRILIKFLAHLSAIGYVPYEDHINNNDELTWHVWENLICARMSTYDIGHMNSWLAWQIGNNIWD